MRGFMVSLAVLFTSQMAPVDPFIKDYPVDPSRIYITGASNGGVGTWEALRRRPRFFAAAAPICGIGHVPSAKTFAKVPIWMFHGDQWSVDDSTRFSQRRLRDGAA